MWLKRLNNNRGFSLIEAMVSAGLMALVASGMVGLVTSMNKEQNNQFRTAALRELKTKFQYLITDQNSWNQTLQYMAAASDPLALCIKNRSNCSAIGIADVVLRDSAGNAFYTPVPNAVVSPSYVVANGFTDRGTACTTFNGNSGAGVDTCPIAYKIAWEPVCAGSPCFNPLIKVTVRLLYNPSATQQSQALSLGNGNLSTGAFSTADTALPGKYDVVMKRSAASVNKAFTIQISSASAVVGGGTCAATPASSARGLATNGPGWSEMDDAFELVTVNTTNGRFSVRPGTYNCKVNAAGWAVDSFSIKLQQITPTNATVAGSEASSNAPTSTYKQAFATSSPILSVSGTTDYVYELQQSCNNPTFVAAGDQKYTMGMPAAPYSGTSPSVFATVTCTQTN